MGNINLILQSKSYLLKLLNYRSEPARLVNDTLKRCAFLGCQHSHTPHADIWTAGHIPTGTRTRLEGRSFAWICPEPELRDTRKSLAARLWLKTPTTTTQQPTENTVAANTTPAYVVTRLNAPYVTSLSYPVSAADAVFTDTAQVRVSTPKWHVERVVYDDEYSNSY